MTAPPIYKLRNEHIEKFTKLFEELERYLKRANPKMLDKLHLIFALLAAESWQQVTELDKNREERTKKIIDRIRILGENDVRAKMPVIADFDFGDLIRSVVRDFAKFQLHNGNDKKKCLYEIDTLLRRYMRFYLTDKNIKKFGEKYKPYIIIGCIAMESDVKLTYTAPISTGKQIFNAVYPVLKSKTPEN